MNNLTIPIKYVKGLCNFTSDLVIDISEIVLTGQRNLYSKVHNWGDLQDGGQVRHGDHLFPHKYIKNTPTCGTTPTEHLLNAGRRPQTSQKARNSPRTWVGQKKKEKNRDERIGAGPAPLGGSCEGGQVSTH